MTTMLENEHLIVTIAEFGAEVISIKNKKNQLEYIWQGDPKYWGRHAPILFPIVGRLKDDQYTYEGQAYAMNQHGFARDQLFTVIEHGRELASFALKSDQKTKQIYPFDFELVVTYRLENMRLLVDYQVENTGDRKMYFSIGGHPAFRVPLEDHLSFENYYLSFAPQKSRTQIPLIGAYIDHTQKTLAQTNISFNLTRDLFKNDALIFETKGHNVFTIESDEGQARVSVGYDQLPFVGIWSPYPQEAPFLCIEPWAGVADDLHASGKLEEKIGIEKLETNQLFQTNYFIEIN